MNDVCIFDDDYGRMEMDCEGVECVMMIDWWMLCLMLIMWLICGGGEWCDDVTWNEYENDIDCWWILMVMFENCDVGCCECGILMIDLSKGIGNEWWMMEWRFYLEEMMDVWKFLLELCDLYGNFAGWC